VRVALINPTPIDHYSPCIRSLAGYLKAHGHHVKMIFLPADNYNTRFEPGFIKQMEQSLVEGVLDQLDDIDLVGVSFLTSMFDVAVQITRACQARYPDKHIAWGGFHPTTMPQQALDFVDMVSVGEGEEGLLELCDALQDGKEPWDIRNWWFRKPNGKIVGNPHRPLIQDLDTLPFQDFSLEDDWTWEPSKMKELVKVEWDMFKNIVPTYPDRNGDLRVSYKTMITRGCPHKCSYCGVAFQHDLYKGQRYLRRRSVEHLVGEVKEVMRNYPEIGIIHFQDDVFFSTSTEEIQKFSEHWKREIGMPFRAQCSPATINEEKFSALIDAGLVFTELGIQTGSSETMRMYKRGMTNEQLLKAVNIITKYADHMQVPDYHMILDNPWESTEDVMKGLRLICTLPPPYNLLPSSLIFYPGTEFFHKAMEDGFVTDEYAQVYRSSFHAPKGNYLNFLFFLTLFNNMPKEIVMFAASDRFVRRFNQKKYDFLWGQLYRYGERFRNVKQFASFATKGKLLEITSIRELKRVANQMK
jgi:anaerobic magnesium-protoporphyrin IX monomethyl ester cyclase